MRELPPIEVIPRMGWHACIIGFGRRRRVQISADLLQEAPDSIVQAVLAHEHGHHILHHVEQKLATVLVISTLVGYGLATLNPWILGATVMIAPIFWQALVMTQEAAADKHALMVEGQFAVVAMLTAMLQKTRTHTQKASILVRLGHARGLKVAA